MVTALSLRPLWSVVLVRSSRVAPSALSLPRRASRFPSDPCSTSTLAQPLSGPAPQGLLEFSPWAPPLPSSILPCSCPGIQRSPAPVSPVLVASVACGRCPPTLPGPWDPCREMHGVAFSAVFLFLTYICRPGSGPPPPPKCLLLCASDLSLAPVTAAFLSFCHWLIAFCLLSPAASSLLSLYVAGVDRPNRPPCTNWASSFLIGCLPLLGLGTGLAQNPGASRPEEECVLGLTNRAATSGTLHTYTYTLPLTQDSCQPHTPSSPSLCFTGPSPAPGAHISTPTAGLCKHLSARPPVLRAREKESDLPNGEPPTKRCCNRYGISAWSPLVLVLLGTRLLSPRPPTCNLVDGQASAYPIPGTNWCSTTTPHPRYHACRLLNLSCPSFPDELIPTGAKAHRLWPPHTVSSGY